LSAYYFSKKGKFEFDQLLNIFQFPGIKFSKKDYFSFDDAAKNWINNQKHFFSNLDLKISGKTLLSKDMIEKINNSLKKELSELNYL